MDKNRAYEIINALSEGINPLTGEILPDDHLCNTGDVLRALQVAAKLLKGNQKALPKNAGKPWYIEDDKLLCELYNSGIGKTEIAKKFERTTGSISSRIIKLGLEND